MLRRIAVPLGLSLLAACQAVEAPRPVTEAPPPPAIERSRVEAGRDESLKARVQSRIAELDRRAFRAVTVEIWGGRVLLMGAVIKPEQRRRAEQTAAAIPGVTQVLNELVLAEDRALDIFAADPAREDALRRKLGISGPAGTVVRVINGVAFLLGGAATAEAADEMKADAIEVDGIKWVVAHLKVSS